MTNIRMSALVGLIGLCICTALPFSTFAQTYPTRPIRIVVGFSPGGAVDITARLIAKELTESMGQSVIVDNRPGATGNIAADIVAKSVPDGYTLYITDPSISMPSLFANLPFDVKKDFVPVSLVAVGPAVLVANPSVPANNVKELIALAKAKPGKLTYGSGGVGNINQLYMEKISLMAGIQMVHVPYKGAAAALIGVMSGEIDMIFASIAAAGSQIKAGKVKPLCVSLSKRSSALPDVPTVDESGLPGYNVASWYGLFAPAGISKNILGILSQNIMKVMRVQGVIDRFALVGLDPVGNSPEEFSEFMRQEIPKWAEVIKAAGIKPQ